MAQPDIPGGPAHPSLDEQPVVRTTSAAARKNKRKLEEIAERVARREAARRGVSDDEPDEDDDTDEVEPETAVDEAVEEARVVSAGTLGAVPPAEPQPRRRRGPSMSEVVALGDEDTGRENRRFTDLFGDFDIGNGQFHVTVERQEPKVFEGIPTRGQLPAIWKPMTWDDFRETYGGHKYELIVYHEGENKKVRRRSKPITVHVPDLSPVIEVVSNFGKDESTMAASQIPGRGTRPATNADARMFDSELQAEERREERRDRQLKEREAREKRAREEGAQEVQREANQMLVFLREQMQAREIEVRRLHETIEEMRNSRQQGPDLDGTAKVITASRPSAQETAALRDLQDKLTTQHAEEVRRLTERATSEVQRLSERHQDEVRSLREQHTGELRRLDDRNVAAERTASERIAAAEARANERITAVETRANERIASIESRATAQLSEAKDRISAIEVRAKEMVTEAKSDGDRRATDIQNRHAERVQDIERQHKHELEGIRERWDLQVKGEGTSWQSRLDLKDAELSRTKAELEQVREEARKPLAERITELATAAEAIGYSKEAGGTGEEPKDWKSTGMDIISSVAQNFPEILRAAGDTFAKSRNSAPAVQVQQFAHPSQMHQAPALPAAVARRRGGFATEDGPDYEGPTGTRPPVYPAGAPAQTPGTARPVAQPPMQPVPVPTVVPEGFAVVPAQPAPLDQQPVMQPATPVAMAPQPSGTSIIPPAPAVPTIPSIAPAAPANDDAGMDAQILQLRPLFEGAYEAKASADDLAQYCLQNFGKPTVAMILQMGVTPERVLMAMQRGGFATSRLCRRDGQKYLRDTFNVLKKLAA
jgi:hypothetical protein